MTSRLLTALRHAAFIAGLLALAWVGAGYGLDHPAALAFTVLIGGFYLTGAAELRRYRRDSVSLASNLKSLDAAPADLPTWLLTLPAGLRQTVRRRIGGEPVGFAGPALAPYLAGLLVLLGMLGTFVGMVLTLRGTGAALASAADLQAVRGALVAPVQGLGIAFGTSIAGVATSAALGLMSALARGERAQAAQLLDGRIATTLHGFSPTQHRDSTRALLQRQADLMPALVDTLRTTMESIDRRDRESAARLQAGQDAFHAKADAAYTGLAAALDRTLRETLESLNRRDRESAARLQAGQDAFHAKADASDAGLATALDRTLRETLESLDRRDRDSAARLQAGQDAFHAAAEKAYAGLATSVEHTLRETLVEGARIAGDTIRPVVESTLSGIARETAALHGSLADAAQLQVDRLSTRFEAVGERVATTWDDAIGRHERASRESQANGQAALTAAVERVQAALAEAVERGQAALVGAVGTGQAALTGAVDRVQSAVDGSVEHVAAAWSHALAQQERVHGEMATRTGQALDGASAAFERHAATLVGTVERAHAELQAASAQRDQQREAASVQAFEGLASALRDEWQRVGAAAQAGQQQWVDTLTATTHQLTTEVGSHTRGTLAEVARLMQAAGEAPRAAAEAIVELRGKLADSVARDNTLLDERARLLDTLARLLDGVDHAALAQRGAIDALVTSSATLLDRVGERFGERVDADAGRLAEAAAQVGGSAAEVADLGQAFSAAVQSFSASNEALLNQLQRIEGALDKSLARSDEQLAYYVAQAREVVDLSILSQRQILDELQRAPSRTAE